MTRNAPASEPRGGCLTRDVIVAVLRDVLAGRSEVVAGYLFGSYAAERATPASDVDIAVLLDGGYDLEADPLCRLDLMAALAARLRLPVDVVILNDAPLVLRHQILTYGERAYEADRRQRIAYEVRSLQLYFDFRPILDRISAALHRQIQEGTFGHQYRGHRDPFSDALRARERLEGSGEYDV